VGVATRRGDGHADGQLLTDADEQLYRAKAEGRAKVCIQVG
jgi:PleD family two-component response regulator